MRVTVNVGCAGSLVLTINVAMRGPVAVGLKVRVNAQLEVGARLAPQLPAGGGKSTGFRPPIPMLTLSAPAPVLESCTVCGRLVVPTNWGGKDTDGADTLAIGVAAAVPLAVTDTISIGVTGSFVPIVSVAVKAPKAAGVIVTVIVQLPLGATLGLQLLVCVVLEAFAPEGAMLTINGAVPVFVTVTG